MLTFILIIYKLLNWTFTRMQLLTISFIWVFASYALSCSNLTGLTSVIAKVAIAFTVDKLARQTLALVL